MPDESYTTVPRARNSPLPKPVVPIEGTTPESPTVANGRHPAKAAPTIPAPTLEGTEIVPGYELLGELGRGGMGVVYKARQIKADRLVALKMILAGEHASADELARFRTEAEAIANLRHPNVVQVFEVGEHRGKPFFSLEYCEAGGLNHKLNGAPLPPGEAALLLEKLARGIQAAHDKGIVHRDLKPSNVLFTAAEEPKITDFGLAKRMDEKGHTLTGTIMGTPSYMAPEQAAGKKEVGPAADIYALGAILYDCLTGRPPFDAASAFDTLAMVINEEHIPVSRLNARTPRDLETICAKCLQKSPAKRYASAGALADDLARFRRGEAIHARPVGSLERFAKWVRRNPAVASLTATTALALLIGASVALGLAIYAWGQAELAQTREKLADLSANEARRETRRADAAALVAIDKAAEERLARETAQTNEKLLKRSRHSMRLMLAVQAWGSSDVVRARSLLGESEPEFQTTWEDRFVRGLCVRRDPLFALTYHTRGPLAMSADGQRIASVGHDKHVRVWDALTGKEKFSSKGHTQLLFGLAISADGQRVVSSGGAPGKPGELKSWDGTTGKAQFSFEGHTDRVTSVAISGDGKRIVSGSWDKSVRLWNAETGAQITKLEGAIQAVGNVAMSADGKWIASSSVPDTVTMWDADKGQPVSSFRVNQQGITCMAMDANAKILVVCCLNSVTVWDARTGLERGSLRGHAGHVHRLAISADGQRIFSAGSDKTVRVWSSRTGLELLCHRGHPDEVLGVAVSADGERVVSGGQDAPMQVWKATTGQALCTFTGHTNAAYRVAFAGKRIVTGSYDNSIGIWDAELGRRSHTLNGHTRRVVALAVSRDGKSIASAGQDLAVKIWDADTGQPRQSWSAHKGGTTCVSFSPDGRQLVSGSWDKTLVIWDLVTGKAKSTFRGHTNAVYGVEWSPDGKHIASVGQDQKVLVWDSGTQKILHSLEGHAGRISCVTWSHDGDRLASASADNTVRVWNATTGKGELVLRGHASGVNGVAWSPDGKRLATVSHDQTVKVWDAETGQFKLTLEGHTAQVWAVAWSADGNRILSGAWDNTAKVWSAETGGEALR